MNVNSFLELEKKGTLAPPSKTESRMDFVKEVIKLTKDNNFSHYVTLSAIQLLDKVLAESVGGIDGIDPVDLVDLVDLDWVYCCVGLMGGLYDPGKRMKHIHNSTKIKRKILKIVNNSLFFANYAMFFDCLIGHDRSRLKSLAASVLLVSLHYNNDFLPSIYVISCLEIAAEYLNVEFKDEIYPTIQKPTTKILADCYEFAKSLKVGDIRCWRKEFDDFFCCLEWNDGWDAIKPISLELSLSYYYKKSGLVPNPIENIRKLKKIGNGTSGKVYKIRNNDDGFCYAAKSYKYTISDPSFLIEISILSFVDHENVMGMVSMTDDYVFFELGIPLDVLLSYSKVDVFDYTKQLLKGLDYLHNNGIIHCDIKTENLILVGKTLKISDFGLSYFFTLGEFVGNVITVMNRPPECLLGMNEMTFDIDIWSLGCVVFEMKTKKKLFLKYGPDEVSVLVSIYEWIGAPTDENYKKRSGLEFNPKPKCNYDKFPEKLRVVLGSCLKYGARPTANELLKLLT